MLVGGAGDIIGGAGGARGREEKRYRNGETRMSALNATIRRYRSRNYFRFSINSRIRANVRESVPLTVSFRDLYLEFRIPNFPEIFR